MFKIRLAQSVAYTVAAIAAISSFGHQVALLALADLDPLFGFVPSEYVTPLTVDALAIIALVVRYADVSQAVRRAALIPLILAGTMSVAANVATAHNVVGVVVGVWTVAAYIIAEVFVSKLDAHAKAVTAVTVNTAEIVSAAVVTPAVAAARTALEISNAAAPTPAPVVAESPEVLAYRAAKAKLGRESALAALNGSKLNGSNGN